MHNTPLQCLKKYWGHQHFRSSQQEIIEAVLSKRDILALMPTGGGKSVCFQVPAMMMEGVCLVITPLIALMQDQVTQLKKRGIRAVALHSGMRWGELGATLDNCAYGKVKFLYLSPERLQTALFKERMAKIPINLIVVDEAHCISEWGYDFRPSYLKLTDLRETHPHLPWIALTATATKIVKEDILLRLRLRNPQIFQTGFARKNLSFVVRRIEHSEKQLLMILQRVGGAALIYTRSRRNTERLAERLQRKNLLATFFHAGIPQAAKQNRQAAWINGKIRIMVATNAFGMGIDKADVRLVIHVDVPETLEAYYQEAGRAGRDGKRAYAVMLYSQHSLDALRDKVSQAHPTVGILKKTYQALANYYGLAIDSVQGESFDLNLNDFCKRYEWRPSSARHALKRLAEQNVIAFDEGRHVSSSIHIQTNRKTLYAARVAHVPCDRLIKSVLRIYGAEVFSENIPISESQIANALDQSVTSIKKMLESLHNRQLIHYRQASDLPQITFLTPRQDARTLTLNKKQLNRQRKQAKDKQEAVIAYAEQSHRCRMQTLQSYFGEETFARCGRCDVCMQQKKQGGHSLVNLYQQRIKELLTNRPATPEQLEKNIEPRCQKKFIQAIRTLLDAAEVRYEESGCLKNVRAKEEE